MCNYSTIFTTAFIYINRITYVSYILAYVVRKYSIN